MSIYEEVYGRKKENDAMLEANERAQENNNKIYQEQINFLNNTYLKFRGSFRDKFISVRTMIDNPDWFIQYGKYIEPDFYKGDQGESDVLADVVNTMRNLGKDGISILSLRDYMLSNMHRYPGIFEDEIEEAFNMLGFVKPDNRYLKFTLHKMIGLTTLKKILANPEVFEVNGVDTKRQDEVDKLLQDDARMFEILDSFNGDKELVSEIRAFLVNNGNTYDFDVENFK